jgi:uncharacterized protein (DUF433 family)
MADERLLARVAVDPKICAGRPFIRGTRIYIAIILDALTQGLSPEEVVEHYPSLETEDLHAAVAYASRLAENNGGRAVLGRQSLNNPLQPL